MSYHRFKKWHVWATVCLDVLSQISDLDKIIFVMDTSEITKLEKFQKTFIGVNWCSLVFHWCSLVFIGVPLVFIGVHWCSIGVHWCSIGVHWCSLVFIGVPLVWCFRLDQFIALDKMIR